MLRLWFEFAYFLANIYGVTHYDREHGPQVYNTMKTIELLAATTALYKYSTSYNNGKESIRVYGMLILAFYALSRTVVELYLNNNWDIVKILANSQLLILPILVAPFLKLSAENNRFLQYTNYVGVAYTHMKFAEKLHDFSQESLIRLYVYCFFIGFFSRNTIFIIDAIVLKRVNLKVLFSHALMIGAEITFLVTFVHSFEGEWKIFFVLGGVALLYAHALLFRDFYNSPYYYHFKQPVFAVKQAVKTHAKNQKPIAQKHKKE